LFGFQKARRSKTEKPKGESGTPIYGGYIVSNEKDAALTGVTKYETFSNVLANVGIVASGTRYFLNLVAKAEWSVVPPEGSGEAGEQVAEKIDYILKNMESSWHSIVRRAAMYRFYGFSIQEWTAKQTKDGYIGFADVAARPQRTIEQWFRDNTGKIILVHQRSPQTNDIIPLPRRKLVYIVDDSLSDSPEGLGLFRHVALPAKRLMRYEQLEGCGFEEDLRGIPVGRAPYAALQDLVNSNKLSKSERDQMVAHLETFMNSHVQDPSNPRGLLLDSMTYTTDDEAERPSNIKQWDIELIKGNATSQEAVANAIDRETRNIARILGVEQLLLGESALGSFALSRDKSNNFALIIDGTLMELRSSFEKDLVEPIMMLNGWPEELKPKLKTDSTQYRDIEQITNALRNLAASGAMISPDDPVINTVRRILGLPELDFEKLDFDSSLFDNPKEKDEEKEEVPEEKEEEPENG
jgi:hypothetical protein